MGSQYGMRHNSDSCISPSLNSYLYAPVQKPKADIENCCQSTKLKWLRESVVHHSERKTKKTENGSSGRAGGQVK